MDKEEIKKYYSNEIERNRLEMEFFQLEGIRTKEIIGRYLTSGNQSIIDIGGGAGFYAFWLAGKGHEVTLIDLSPRNVEIAREIEIEKGIKLCKIEVGDATQLNFGSDQFDLVLLLGPLYHLRDRKERIRALSEAKRVLKPGGFLICAVISRYASLFDGFSRDLILDDRFEQILIQDLKTGEHMNPTDNEEYFTTAFFHRPFEIREEITESGLAFEKLVAVESFGWTIENLNEKIKNESYRRKFQSILELIEENENIMAISPHILGIGRKV